MANTEDNKLNSGASATADVTVVAAVVSETLDNSETIVSSTTSAIPEKPAEPTKRSIRVDTWKKIMNKKLSISNRIPVFNRIPRFIDATKASDLLKETDEFKSAKNIKVDLEGTREPTRLNVLEAEGKKLYISPKRSSNAILAEINFQPEKSDDIDKKAAPAFYINDYATEIGLENKVELDLLVFGSVAVSKTGQYIGRGYGFVDLDFAILRHCGVITDKTIIATLVHDEQLYDTLPETLFTDYDVPVDMIVTPTQVIRVEKRLPRPNGIKWNLISSRRLERSGALKIIKEQEEKNGKIIVLKEDDTDVESNRKPFPRANANRRFRKRQSRSGGENATADDEKKPSPRRRGFYRKDRKSKKSGEDQDKSDRRTDGEDSEPQTVSKSSLRTKMWKQLNRHHRIIAYPYTIFNRIPTFIGANTAASLLAETEEFKNASNIKVGHHRAQVPVKYVIIDASKNLYCNVYNKESKAAIIKINCAADAPIAEKRQVARNQSKNISEIEIKDAVPLDMLVVGAVAVSKSGIRLGRGDGHEDLDFAILAKSGFITDKTVIVATVHDEQVLDSIPSELLTANDMPVDIIVTNTKVIHVKPRLVRPKGIVWPLITQQKLNTLPVLQAIKETEEEAGVTIELKESNGTDTERAQPTLQRRRRRNRQTQKRNNRRRTDDQQDESGLDDEGVSQTNGGFSRRRPFNRTRRSKRSTGTDAEQSGEGGDNNETTQNNDRNKKRKQFSRRNHRHICIQVSNIPRNLRVREFKTELKEHGCNPRFISWKGFNRRCILHFENPTSGDQVTAINEITKTLENITLVPKKPSTNSVNNVDEGLDQQTQESHPVDPPTSNEPQKKLRIEVLNRRPEQQRIESVDVTAV